MITHYTKILKDTENRIRRSFAIQVTDDRESLNYGGFYDVHALVEPKFAIYRTTTMIAGYFCKDSCFFGDNAVYERILAGLSYIQRAQRENGLFDLINCNFYSGPDTAFCLKRLIPYYIYLKRHTFDDIAGADMKQNASVLLSQIETILKRGANAMISCGFHTPNHRWAIASVLMLCSVFFDSEDMKQAANKYLNEGIDCNADGEYAERSAGNYNRICNDAMIMLYHATKDTEYLDYAAANLQMMLFYIEPDDSIFTNNSTRQDRGAKIYPKDYYMEYLYLGYFMKNDAFLDAANRIMEIVDNKGLTAMDCLIHFMNLPELLSLSHEGSYMPPVYEKHFKESNLVRVRRKDFSYSLINHCSSFLYFQHGDLNMSMKIGASFCEHRAFLSESLEQKATHYEMKQTMVGWYYLPFETAPETTDWWKMDHTKRNKLLGPNLEFLVEVTEVRDGIDVHIKTSGIDRAPLRIELAFDGNTNVKGDSFVAEGSAGQSMIAKEGIVTVSKGAYAISAGPAFGKHDFSAGKFGSEARDPHCFTLVFTDFTCFDHVISLRAKPSNQ